MRRLDRPGLARSGLGLLLMMTVLLGWWSLAQRSPHSAASDCASCHLNGRHTTPEQAHLLVASQEKLCASCHPSAAQLSHPSGFTPRQGLPADYPLDWKGELSCSSCHLVHGRTPKLLRGSRQGKALCLACHEPAFFARMRDQGSSLMAVGHLDTAGVAPGVALDPYSRQCMECHGGKGEAREARVDAGGRVRHGSSALNHPLGGDYAQSARFGGYRPLSQLPKRMLLPGGQIACVSCHEGYSQQHGKLLLPKAGSALCFACHDL